MNAAAGKLVLIMAGGTGGHVFPALAVADALRAAGHRVAWLGTRAGIEARLVPAAGIDIEWLPVGGLRGKGAATLLLAPFRLLRAGVVAWRVLRRLRPDAVIGMGGFASGPGGAMAWLARRPLLVHEQNAIAGFTNRMLAKFATRVLAAFPQTLPREEVVGNPVRESVLAVPPPGERFASREGSLRILVLGGSLGANALNEIVPQGIAESGLRVDVLHQCGRGDADAVRRLYEKNGTRADVKSFIDNMAEAYAQADIAICRAGAMTVFELAAAGLGAILVPFPHAVDDHQTANARYLADEDAALVMQERDLSSATLAAALRDIGSRERLAQMAARAHRKARPGATRDVARACVELAGGAA